MIVFDGHPDRLDYELSQEPLEGAGTNVYHVRCRIQVLECSSHHLMLFMGHSGQTTRVLRIHSCTPYFHLERHAIQTRLHSCFREITSI